MVTVIRPVQWHTLGTRAVLHLFDVRDKASPFDPAPLCGQRGIAVVERRDGTYCRFCVAHEGLP